MMFILLFQVVSGCFDIMSGITVDIAKLTEEANKYNYIRFCSSDIHGIARSKTVPSKYASRFFEDGLGCYSGKFVYVTSKYLYE